MKKLYTFFVIILFVSKGIYAESPDLTGNGTPENPYLVGSAADLDQVRKCLSCSYLQTADIDLIGIPNWEPIAGNGSSDRFTGHYDGAGYTISNLTIARPGTANIGLFGHIGMDGTGHTSLIRIKLVNAKVTGGRGTGALVGRVTGNQNTRIEYCSVSGGAEGYVTGDAAVGGLVGSHNSYRLNNANAESFRPVIFACWADIDVSMRTGTTDPNKIKYGGLTGCNQKGLISNSYARGSVTVGDGANRVGGLAGCIDYRGIIINSYATGIVTGTTSATLIGGLLGSGGNNNSTGTVSSSYYPDTQPSGPGGNSLSNTGLRQSASFVGWDFQNVWSIAEGVSFPELRENLPASVVWKWSGGTDNVWRKDGNWVDINNISKTGYPPNGAEVLIPTGIAPDRWPVISQNETLFRLTMEGNTELTILGDETSLTITGCLVNESEVGNPLLFGEGQLILKGTTTQFVPGLIYNDLTIDNLNNTQLAADITVNGTLEMVNGFLDLNGYTITLGENATIKEWESVNTSSRIYGTEGLIRTVRTLNAPEGDIAGLGLDITSDFPLGQVTIERGHSELTANNGSSQSIMRWFTIEPTESLPDGFTANLTFHYNLAEISSEAPEPILSLFKRSRNGSEWNDWVLVNSDEGNKTLTARNITSFSQWTASDASTPLPIILLSFEGKPVNDGVKLSWVTAAEINNDFFTLERSTNARDFYPVAFLSGAGTTSQTSTYQYIDAEPPTGIVYYRLKQTDFNGEFEYSGIISVYLQSNTTDLFRIFPNPNRGRFNILATGDDPYEYFLYDMQGRLQYHGKGMGGIIEAIELTHLRPGIYSLIVIGRETITNKIQVN